MSQSRAGGPGQSRSSAAPNEWTPRSLSSPPDASRRLPPRRGSPHVHPSPGQYQRHEDPVTHRDVVVTGTFAPVERSPVNLFQAAVAIRAEWLTPPRWSSSCILMRRCVHCGRPDRCAPHVRSAPWFANSARRETLIIPVSCAAFALGGALENMQEEIIAFVPSPPSADSATRL